MNIKSIKSIKRIEKRAYMEVKSYKILLVVRVGSQTLMQQIESSLDVAEFVAKEFIDGIKDMLIAKNIKKVTVDYLRYIDGNLEKIKSVPVEL